ncbi:MAG: chlorophyllide reductase subunit Y, partial [Pseudomonadota bacterium]
MTEEVRYDAAGEVEVIAGKASPGADAPMPVDGMGCHSGSEMVKAAEASGNSDLLAKLKADYPTGPHD